MIDLVQVDVFDMLWYYMCCFGVYGSVFLVVVWRLVYVWGIGVS